MQKNTFDPTFQSICFNGKHMLFGSAQSQVIKQLYYAGKNAHPYVHFKDLLFNANSRSIYLRDLFRSNKNWRLLIQHGGRGFYRLNEDFFK